jgi:hypothetical protein
MIVEFQRHWEEQYKIKTSEQLQSVIDKRNTLNEKNDQTQHERNTAADMDETRADGDDDDEGGNSEDDHGEYEDGSGSAGDGTTSQTKRRRMSRQHLAVPDTSESPERLFSSVGLVKSDLRGSLLDTTLIDVMWVKQAP